MTRLATVAMSIALVTATGQALLPSEDHWTQMIRVASHLQDSGDCAGAERILSRLLRDHGTASSGDPRLAVALNNLATVYQELGNASLAEKFYLRAIRAWENPSGNDAVFRAVCLNSLAGLYLENQQFAKAQRLLARFVRPQVSGLEDNGAETARMLENLGAAYYGQGKYRDAEEAYRTSLRIAMTTSGPDRAATLSILNNLGTLYMRTRRVPEAREHLEQALAILERQRLPDLTSLIRILVNLSTLAGLEHRWDDAEVLLNRAFGAASGKLPQEHPLLASIWSNYAEVYRHTHRKHQAKDAASRAEAILAIRASGDSARHTTDLEQLIAEAALARRGSSK